VLKSRHPFGFAVAMLMQLRVSLSPQSSADVDPKATLIGEPQGPSNVLD
jgi:hypothetical protein